MIETLTALAAVSVAAWLYLIFLRGQFWRADQRFDPALATRRDDWPAVAVVVPARDEAQLIGRSMGALLAQDYPGQFAAVLVDDHSADGTAEAARAAADGRGMGDRLAILRGAPVPAGWTGKLWALAQGIDRAAETVPNARYLLFTDADIEHDPKTLGALVAKAEAGGLDLVSLMASLHCRAPWERLLVPAFVFFFEKLYPFAWVNDARRATAAAAGGCALVRRDALVRAGGLRAFAGALIDDCALARAIKPGGAIWLGLAVTTRSIRPHAGLADIWDMVVRSAFTQLRHSTLALAATVAGMLVVYIAPPAAAVAGALTGDGPLLALGSGAWMMMSAAYIPALRLYRQPPAGAALLPAAALLYTVMTVDSALRHWRGRGGAWKGRRQSPPAGR